MGEGSSIALQMLCSDPIHTHISTLTVNIFKNKLDKLWEQEGIMYDPDLDIYL